VSTLIPFVQPPDMVWSLHFNSESGVMPNVRANAARGGGQRKPGL